MFEFDLTFQHFIKTSNFQNIITELALIECDIDTTAELNRSHDIFFWSMATLCNAETI